MKAYYIILVSLLVFTACHRQQAKQHDDKQKNAPMVIDYPAGILITSPKKATITDNYNITIAKQILAPHNIPVLDSSARRMVFVKMNGDKVSLFMDEMEGKYDIILFNAVSNPVPLRINDLKGALDKIFHFPAGNNLTKVNKSYPDQKNSPEADTLNPEKQRKLFSGINRDKKIIVTSTDTSYHKFLSRTFPGIEWIEQKPDTRTILKVSFENDLITYANTDRYFTNGITFDLQAPWLSRSPVQKLMIPYRHKANVTYHLSMVQDMYTPTDTRVAPTLNNDRPYSSYLYFGIRKITADPLRKFKIATELDAGYMGPYSPGSYMQTLVHKTFPSNDAPLGWETQINTDIILNYNVLGQLGLVNKKNFTLLAGLDAKAGTLLNSAGAGLQLQAGKAEPVFGLSDNESWPSVEYYFFAKTNLNFVAYNALLQGGMFNHNNVFTLKNYEIHRVVGNASAGIHFRYKGIGIELAQHFLSPEYKGGLWHKWGRMTLSFKL